MHDSSVTKGFLLSCHLDNHHPCAGNLSVPLDFVAPGMKGTGRWTIQEAAERSTAAPTMAAALDARYLSGRKAERVAASAVLKGPSSIPKVPNEQLVEDLKAALYCSKICSYAQVCAVEAGIVDFNPTSMGVREN